MYNTNIGINMKNIIVLFFTGIILLTAGCARVCIEDAVGNRVSGWGLVSDIKINMETTGNTNNVTTSLAELDNKDE